MVVVAKATAHAAPYSMPQAVKWQIDYWWRLLGLNQNIQSYEDRSLPIEINRQADAATGFLQQRHRILFLHHGRRD